MPPRRHAATSSQSARSPEGVLKLKTVTLSARSPPVGGRSCNGSVKIMAAAPGLSSTHSCSVRMPAPVAPITCRQWLSRTAARSAGSGLAAYSGVRNNTTALARDTPARCIAWRTARVACWGSARCPWLRPVAAEVRFITSIYPCIRINHRSRRRRSAVCVQRRYSDRAG